VWFDLPKRKPSRHIYDHANRSIDGIHFLLRNSFQMMILMNYCSIIYDCQDNQEFWRKVVRFSPDAYSLVAKYDWPADAREMSTTWENRTQQSAGFPIAIGQLKILVISSDNGNGEQWFNRDHGRFLRFSVDLRQFAGKLVEPDWTDTSIVHSPRKNSLRGYSE